MSTDSSTESNLGIYSELTAAILQRVVSGGLKRQTLSSEDVYKELPHLASTLEAFDEMFVDTLMWLRDERYVRFLHFNGGTRDETCAQDLVPTALCLAAMDVRIDALEGKTAGQVLAANTKGEVSAGSYIKAGSFLGGMFGGVIKSLGGG